MKSHSDLSPVRPVQKIRPLDRAFFARNPRRVARKLLGKVLVRDGGKLRLAARIVEVEAYLGESDAAAHAAAGKTARTSVLFGPPGYAYVYFIYGTHYCLNVTCEREGKAGAVLFRALEPLAGIEEMARARGIDLIGPRDLPKLTSGPGRLAEAFGITRLRDNGVDLTGSNRSGSNPTGSKLTGSKPASSGCDLWIGEDGFRAAGILITPRIGISKAADRPLRYLLSGNAFVSGRKSAARVKRPRPAI